MRSDAAAVVACLSLSCGAQTIAPEIETRKVSDDAYELTLRSTTVSEVAAGQQQLAPTAVELCKGKGARFGRYEFNLQERIRGSGLEPTSFVLKQQVRCGADPEGQPAVVSASGTDWRPTDAEKATIERMTYQYFRAKDFGSLRDGYLLFNPGVLPWERWKELTEQFNAAAGQVRSRQISKVTWYKDPPSKPPGLYVAVDYSSQFENLALQCGYVVWQQQPNGSFLLIREEQNLVGKAQAAKMSVDELNAVRARYKCQ